MRLSALFFACQFILSSLFLNAQKPQLSNPPAWAKVISPDLSLNPGPDASNGSFYLLIDYQDNVPAQSRYYHFAIKILNPEGVQSMSTISWDFDPSYEKLTFHSAKIIRDGQEIDRLSNQTINTFQRETGMERNLYDGSLTAVLNLPDVRVGDIIEYSLTEKGYNPIHNGRYYGHHNFEFSSAIGQFTVRVMLAENNSYQLKYFNDAPEAVISHSRGMETYHWDLKNIPATLDDLNTPSWHAPYASVLFSSYENWGEVVNWGLKNYTLPKREINRIGKKMEGEFSGSTKEEQILEAIRFVQDEIRYLGFENGMGAYKPKMPSNVLDQRFGDCKDKSLLLTALLQSMDVDAYPVLVNTSLSRSLNDYLPSPKIFDHCIVGLEFEEKQYWIDPTISEQGGSLSNYFFPFYGYGLKIKEGEESLQALPLSANSQTVAKEIYKIKEIGGPVELTVETEYSGAKADNMRSYFHSTSLEMVKKEYLNFYSLLWAEMEAVGSIEFLDESRNEENKVFVTEHYVINDFWKPYSEDENDAYIGEVYSLPMEGVAKYANSPNRKNPYALEFPMDYTHKIILKLPEEWPFETDKMEVEGPGFSYEYETSGNDLIHEIYLTHHYKRTKDYIEANEVKSFVEKHKKISKNLAYQLTYNNGADGFKFSWAIGLYSLLLLTFAAFMARKLYFQYDPSPLVSPENSRGIGGWMILPLIGLVLTPFSIIIAFISTPDYFNAHLFSVLVSKSNLGYDLPMAIILLFELSYNILFIAFAALLCLLFFKGRSSLPNLIILYYVINLVFLSVDGYLVSTWIDSNTSIIESSDMGAVIGVLVWIPYFFKSQRVKQTFVHQAKE